MTNKPDLETVKGSKFDIRGNLDLSKYLYTPISNITSIKNDVDSSRSISLSMEKTTAITGLESPELPRSSKRKSRSRTPSPSILSKRRRSTPLNNIGTKKYAPPSKYAHLPELRDVLAPNLICIFVGLNPGLRTALSGHAYAHPSNLFWKLLHSSGCTSRRCDPREDGELPRLFCLGNTNIVSRPTRNGGELKNKELDAGVNILEEKIRRLQPEAVCIVGKTIWESIWRTKYGVNICKSMFRYGWQDETERMGIVNRQSQGWNGAKVFVACSTSGLAASLKPAEKEKIWNELGTWIKERRLHRSERSSEENGNIDIMCHKA